MDDQKQQLAERLGSANNILVTVSSNPTVDQLAACIGLTLALNKLDKHATAVFSGDVPDTIEFLKPEETLEQTTDSLRDFIIALDKSKADKLRYKVEDKVVKIFITPYRTSITQDDLNFSQGDFNVDVVVALGVRQQQDLDQAITAHGRILHDATVASISIDSKGSELGSINWRNPNASSLSEVVTTLLKLMDKKLLDEQIATALLTGIVASTDRFRDDNTTATTMSVSADLMAAGANQQLVTSELEHAVELHDGPKRKSKAPKAPAEDTSDKDGTLEINHRSETPAELPEEEPASPEPEQTLPKPVEDLPEIHAVKSNPDAGKEPTPTDSGRDVMTEPPTFDTALTAADRHEEQTFQPSADFAKPGEEPMLLSHNEPPKQADAEPPKETGALDVASAHPQPPVPAAPPRPPMPASPPPPPPAPEPAEPAPPIAPPPKPPADTSSESDVDAARDEVMRALSEQPDETMPPIAALNAQPLGDRLHEPEPPQPPAAPEPTPPSEPPQPPGPAALSPADQPLDMPLPPKGNIQVPPPQTSSPTNAPAAGPGAPPPVPPPMTPPSWPGPQQQ